MKKDKIFLTSLCLCLALFASTCSYALTISVNALIGEPGCDLVDAINSANNNADIGDCLREEEGDGNGEDDTIRISEDFVEYKITQADDSDIFGDIGLPAITSTIRIVGQNARITSIVRDSEESFRFFLVFGGDLTLENIELRNGNVLPDADGGAIHVTPDRRTLDVKFSSLTLLDVQIIGNNSKEGGGIYLSNDTNLLMKRSTIAWNNAVETPSGGDGIGGGVRAEPIPERGGPTSVRIFDSTFIGNEASKSGGGANFPADAGSTYGIYNTTFFDNKSGLSGGGMLIVVDDDDDVEDLGLSNSITLRNNIIIGNQSGILRGNQLLIREEDLDNNLIIDNNLIGNLGETTFEAINVDEFPGNIISTSDGDQPLATEQILEPSLFVTSRGLLMKRPAIGSPAINSGVRSRSERTGTFPNLILISQEPGCRGETSSIFDIFSYRIDQNEQARPIGNECDMGSYESEHGANDEEQCYVVPTSNNKTVMFCL